MKKKLVRDATEKPCPFHSFLKANGLDLSQSFKSQIPRHLINKFGCYYGNHQYLWTNAPGNDLGVLYLNPFYTIMTQVILFLNEKTMGGLFHSQSQRKHLTKDIFKCLSEIYKT